MIWQRVRADAAEEESARRLSLINTLEEELSTAGGREARLRAALAVLQGPGELPCSPTPTPAARESERHYEQSVGWADRATRLSGDDDEDELYKPFTSVE